MFKSFDEILAKDITCETGLVAQRMQTPSKNLYPSLPAGESKIDARLRRLKARRDPLGLEKGFADFNQALRDVNTSPSPAQIAAGNYKKGHIKLHGLDIAIENPQGSWRHGVDPNGKAWSCQMPYHYGYVKRTEGSDGDQVDVCIGPATGSQTVYVVDQIDPDTRLFDEHKCFLGCHSEFEAKVLYQKAFSDGRGAERIGSMTPMSIDEFKQWLKTGDTTEPVTYAAPMSKGLAPVSMDLSKSAQRSPLDVADQHQATLSGHVADALSWLSDQAGGIADAVPDGAEAAAKAIPVSDFGSKLDNAFETIENIINTVGDQVVNDNIPPGGSSDKKIDVSFDMRNDNVLDYINSTRMYLIREITDDQRESIEKVISDGARDGKSIDQMKRSIRDIVGLTEYQGQTVERYRAELESLDDGALDRALRDKRFDSTIRSAIESGDPLDQGFIDKAVEVYKKRFIDYRATTIARTQGVAAAVEGARLGIEQMLDDDSMDGFTVERTWVATRDNRTRHDHAEMNGQKVIGMHSQYELPNGEFISYPHDPSADPDEVINCRCVETYKIIKDESEGSEPDDETMDDESQDE